MKVEMKKVVEVKFNMTEEDKKILNDAYKIKEDIDCVITQECLEHEPIILITEGKGEERVEYTYLIDAITGLYEFI